MQNYVNLLYREEERERLPLCKAESIGVIPWSPLARGQLTRDWDDSTEWSLTDKFGRTLYEHTADADRKVVGAVAAVAKDRGVPRAQIALAWMLKACRVRADRGCIQAGPLGGRCSRAPNRAERRRDQPP